jgi:hypothetical protein
MESPELSSSLALRLLEALSPHPRAELRLRAPSDVFFFFIAASADLISLKGVGDTYKVEIAVIKASSSCLSTTPLQEPLLAHNRHSATE